ncbi:dihydrofolate reductase family protein [Cohnella terricola]|uniref:5-amino-6-(5-phosphoribosylamino)uracil reductase n=1 Tax=Cohnella terricola TaxID=1289167 RepID=A0A559JQG8_9BACL|nr:dihydrofolate reductase family protein [Cohnella terricola]TVY02125.1 5-amino-6-(5-phosphoribosylamino)uracil reductase [Cohnella terricola]
MRQYKVICHMATSLDGKVEGNYLETPSAEYFGQEYENIHQKYKPKAWICGRVTFEKHFTNGEQVDLSNYSNADVSREDFIADKNAAAFAIAIDPSGKLGWNRSSISEEEYEERPDQHIITVLSENVSNPYLEHLRAIGVSYIFAGKTDRLDLKLALDKISRYFNITEFMLEGGGYINGSFLSAGLVDELSLILVPMVEGTNNAVSLFEYGDNPFRPEVEFTLEKVEQLENSGLWLRYRLKN